MSTYQQSFAHAYDPTVKHVSAYRRTTGFASNTRPYVSYDSKLDRKDPELQELCHPKRHFVSRTKQDYLGTAQRPPSGIRQVGPTLPSAFTTHFPITLPKAQQVAATRDYTTEVTTQFHQHELQPRHKAPGGSAPNPSLTIQTGSLDPAHHSAFLRDRKLTEPITHTNAATQSTARHLRTEMKKRYDTSRQTHSILPDIGLPRGGSDHSPHVWGKRDKPAFYPTRVAEVYGAPVQADPPSVTQRMQRTNPAEYSFRKSPVMNSTWSRTMHADKHAEFTEEGRRYLQDCGREVLQASKPSGFVANVDTFTQPETKPEDRERFATSTSLAFNTTAGTLQDVGAATAPLNATKRVPETNFGRSTMTHKFSAYAS
eukprot:m.49824 g.49824  ORF g.49824 m.49824 type:complete len:371 (-) comp11123_c0_seq1:229-1341(-)